MGHYAMDKGKNKAPASPANPNTTGPRFRTPDTGLVAFVTEFENVGLLGMTREGPRIFFILDIDDRQGEYYKVKYLNSDYLKFENRRRSLVDMTHHRKQQDHQKQNYQHDRPREQ